MNCNNTRFWLLLACYLFVLPASHRTFSADVDLGLPPGFVAEKLYDVPDGQGSWVSMTTDPQGRLIVSDQYGSLYRIDLSRTPVEVSKFEVQVGFAQGLLCAFDALYVVSHPSRFEIVDAQGNKKKVSRAAGLYRLTDTNHDDQYNKVELLREFKGQGEHGPHAVILSPDGKSLYVCAGNHTKLPNPEKSRVPQVWQEDQLTPRLPDAGGHGVGIMAPGGWVCKTDPDGKEFELISIGFRNQYDIAFNRFGDLFTYDADMEWDIGLPWYRPTRVCHVTSGSEFGWRNGSGKWPTYFPDSLPAVVDVGPGSPTGITFGHGAKFPGEYQDSLFVCDWSYGIIYRVILERQNESYVGKVETFCSAPVLPLTDIVVNQIDGSMYFLVGGRRAESALYRISYRGSESTASPKRTDAEPKFRQQIEAIHQDPEKLEIEKVWGFLAATDRQLNFAARTALELCSDRSWHDRALTETDPQTKLTALLALIRTNPGPDLQERTVRSLAELEFDSLSEMQQLHLLRNYGLILTRMGPATKTTLNTIRMLASHYPNSSELVNRELARLLAAAEAPDVVKKTIELLIKSESQEQQIHYAIVLHEVERGWTDQLRTQYLQWFADSSARYAGGNSFRRYLKNIRDRYSGNQSDEVRSRFKQLMTQPIDPVDPYAKLAARPIVKKWTMADFADLKLEDRNIDNGRKMFAVAQCYRCHVIENEGGFVGPQLKGAGRRFSKRDLLETILDPNKEVSDQYQATVFQMDDGRIVTGRVANLANNQYMIMEDMIQPGRLTRINRDEIEAMRPSKISMMPSGLLDSLTRDEILDLLAFMQSASTVE